jgi:hypothetical protein
MRAVVILINLLALYQIQNVMGVWLAVCGVSPIVVATVVS